MILIISNGKPKGKAFRVANDPTDITFRDDHVELSAEFLLILLPDALDELGAISGDCFICHDTRPTGVDDCRHESDVVLVAEGVGVLQSHVPRGVVLLLSQHPGGVGLANSGTS